MGYCVWDREKGGPANSYRYQSRRMAQKWADARNRDAGTLDRFYVKEL